MHNAPLPQDASDILSFWFSEHTRPRWFAKEEAFDATIRERFGALYGVARAGKLQAWQAHPQGILALIILLDQFPRNMFRDSARMFESDSLALALTKAGMVQKFDNALNTDERQFFYMPLMHSEDGQDQALAVTLFSERVTAHSADYARRHQAIIDRFGRFPHRNTIIGRESTPEEIEFLKQPGSGF